MPSVVWDGVCEREKCVIICAPRHMLKSFGVPRFGGDSFGSNPRWVGSPNGSRRSPLLVFHRRAEFCKESQNYSGAIGVHPVRDDPVFICAFHQRGVAGSGTAESSPDRSARGRVPLSDREEGNLLPSHPGMRLPSFGAGRGGLPQPSPSPNLL